MNPIVIMLYVFCLTEDKYADRAKRFAETYLKFPGEYPHRLWVICNGGLPNASVRIVFRNIPCVFTEWEDSGWDIGAYIAATNSIAEFKICCDFVMCCGGDTYFKRSGWLKRMVEVWQKYGPGLYGSSATYEQRPHIQTTTFCCPPELIQSYPYPVVTREDRYNFEWGRNSILARAERRGMPCLLVTWDGEWTKDKWRKPPNIFRRGDQSNLLAHYRATYEYDHATPEQKIYLEDHANGKCNHNPGIYANRKLIDDTFKTYPDVTEQEEINLMQRCI
jgi:hypothetical protein